MFFNSCEPYVNQAIANKEAELGRALTAEERYETSIQAQRELYERPDFYDLPEQFITMEDDFYKKVAKGKTFNGQKYQKLNVHPVYCTPEESEQRKVLQDRAFNTCAKAIALKVAAKQCCEKMYVVNGKYLDRKLQNLLVPFSQNVDELKTKADDFVKATPEGKSQFMSEQINKMAEFCIKLSSATTDEEIVQAFEGNEMLYFALGEVDGLFDRAIVAQMENTLGIHLDEATWEKARFIKDVAVDFNGLLNRVGNISSPYYSKYKDLSFISEFSEWESSDVTENLLGYDEVAENYHFFVQCVGVYDNKAALRTPIYDYDAGRGMYTNGGAQHILSSELFVMAHVSKMNNVSYKMANRVLSKEDAVTALYQKKYVDVYNNDKFVKRIMMENNYGQFHTDLSAEMTLDPRKDQETLTNTLSALKHACDAVNRKTTWYAKLHNALFPGKFTQAVNELNKLLKNNHYNSAKLARKFESIAKKADKYLQKKLLDVPTHTPLTEQRIKAMLDVYNICKIGAQRCKDAQKAMEQPQNEIKNDINTLNEDKTNINVKEAVMNNNLIKNVDFQEDLQADKQSVKEDPNISLK